MKYLTLFTFLFLFNPIQAQQLMSEIGRVNTTFLYTNSDNEALENLYSETDFSYALGYRMTLSESIYLRAGLVFNRYNNQGSDPVYDNLYEWKTSYAGLQISPEYQFLNRKKIRVLAIGSIEPQFFIKGTQTINKQIFDLKGIEQFDKPFLFWKGGLSANYCLDEKVVLSLRYMLGKGNPLGKSADDETLKLKTSTFSIGLLWGIKGCKYCRNQRLQ